MLCQAMRVCCARAARVGARLHTNAGEMFDEALALAAEADARRAAGGPLPPLHGVPCSIKDCVDVAGQDSTCGTAVRALQPSARDSSLVAALPADGW